MTRMAVAEERGLTVAELMGFKQGAPLAAPQPCPKCPALPQVPSPPLPQVLLHDTHGALPQNKALLCKPAALGWGSVIPFCVCVFCMTTPVALLGEGSSHGGLAKALNPLPEEYPKGIP